MASNIKLYLKEDYLPGETIWLEGEKYDETNISDFEEYELEHCKVDLFLSLQKETGNPVHIVVEGFKTETEGAVKYLREYPLPWTFTLESLGIKEKPLEDVLLAIWKKYKNVKAEWEK